MATHYYDLDFKILFHSDGTVWEVDITKCPSKRPDIELSYVKHRLIGLKRIKKGDAVHFFTGEDHVRC